MLLTAIVGTTIGALLAVVPRPNGWFDRLEKLAARVDQLTRSQQKLVDHIERLERELALTQELLAHWRDEAARLARENREHRGDAMMQAAMAQQAQLAQYAPAAAQQMQTFEGFCNCVPSRSQVWGTQHGLVQQLNDNGSA